MEANMSKNVAEALRTTLIWKAHGKDQTQNFCLKQLIETHEHIGEIFNKLIVEVPIPEWLTAGVTYLIKKRNKLEFQRISDPSRVCLRHTKLLQADACRNIWIMKICYQKNRTGAAEQNNAKINC